MESLNMYSCNLGKECFANRMTRIYGIKGDIECFDAILFFGRPEYYPQFGFKEASIFEITDSEGYNYPSFMGMELIPDYLENAKGGMFEESDIYNDDRNRDTVKEFDKSFR